MKPRRLTKTDFKSAIFAVAAEQDRQNSQGLQDSLPQSNKPRLRLSDDVKQIVKVAPWCDSVTAAELW